MNGLGHGDASAKKRSGVLMEIHCATAARAAGKIKGTDPDGYFSA
jgi:hypothetical protein